MRLKPRTEHEKSHAELLRQLAAEEDREYREAVRNARFQTFAPTVDDGRVVEMRLPLPSK